MKFNYLIIVFLLISCTNTSLVQQGTTTPNISKGFALIYNEDDFNNKVISSKLNSSKIEVGHNKYKKNTIIIITNPENKKSLIMGAGGASKAICSKLSSNRISQIDIFDIDKEKADELKRHLQQFNFDVKINIIDNKKVDKIAENSDLIVNCTPVGMKEEDPELINSDFFNSNQFIYDLIYTPSKTRLLKDAEIKGAKIINGLDMLAYQGAESFAIWENVNPPYEIMSKELRIG